MKREALERYEEALLALREELLGEAGQGSPAKEGEEVLDEDTQPLAEMLQVIASKRNSTKAGTLARIDRALEKIEREPEMFGLCAECEEEIAEKRLAAMPYVERCVDCQAERDAPRGGSRRHLTDFS